MKERWRNTKSNIGYANEETNKLWVMLSKPYRLSVSYSVFPVEIKATEAEKVAIKNQSLPIKNIGKKAKYI